MGKEAVLRRLLETQETYIQELEAKCKIMTDQITESPFKAKNQKYQGGLQSTDIDLKALESTQQPFVDKMQILIAHYESVNRTINDASLKNLISALSLLKAEASIQIEVYFQRDQQHQSLIQTLQHRFQKERQEFTSQAEQTEKTLQQKVRILEQEIQVLKRQITKQSMQEEDLNAEVLNELENMEARYKQSDEELRAENLHLKKQLGQVTKQTREIQSQLLNTKQKLDVKSCEEFTLLKRLEDTLKLIRNEVKQAHRLIESSENLQQQPSIQNFPDEQINLTVGEVPEMNLQLQKELEQAYKEIEVLRQSDISDIWSQKLELVEREKKIVQDEIQRLQKTLTQREITYQRDLKLAQNQVKALTKAQTEREQQLEYELLQTKTQIRDLIGQINIQPLQVSLPTPKSDQEQLVALQTENEFIRGHNHCLKSQVQELLIQMGRTTSIAGANSIIDKQIQFNSQQQKLCAKVNDICHKVNLTLDKIECLVSDQCIEEALEERTVPDHSDTNQLKEIKEQNFILTQELSSAKKSLILYINKCNNLEELLDSDLQLDNSQVQRILVKKFAEEINMLKQEKVDLQQLKDQEILYYKEKAKLTHSEQQLDYTRSNSFVENLKNELRQHLSDFKNLVQQLGDSENKQMQAFKGQLIQKRMAQTQNKEPWTQSNNKQVLYEEIALLRDQLDQIQQQQSKAQEQLRHEVSSFEQARLHVTKREQQLVTCIKSIIKAHQQSNQPTNQRSDISQQKSLQLMQSEMENLQLALKTSEQRLQMQFDEKSFILTQKLQLVSDQKDLMEQQLYQLQSKLDVQNEPKKILQQENERLRQHILSRQHEMLEMRNKTQQLQKSLKQKAIECEKELLSKYKDRMSGHLKVFDLELSKLQCILQEL